MLWWPPTTSFGWLGGKTRQCWPYLKLLIKPLLKGGTQQKYRLPWPMLVTLLNRLILAYLPCTHSLIRFLYLLSPVSTTCRYIRYPCNQHLPSYPCPSSISGYWYFEVKSWASNVTINTTKPVCYALNIRMSLSQGLTQMSIYLLVY